MVKQDDAMNAVANRIMSIIDKSQRQNPLKFNVYVVWSGYILGNEKYLISTDLPDGKYYEVTYNKDADEMYLDEYVKIHNEVLQCTAQ